MEASGRRKADAEHNAEIVEASILAWVKRDPARHRIIALLDEADLFFKMDSEDGRFRESHRLKYLMEKTERAFKVVFAGLHNVQRTTRIINHPLAHLGLPICVGPMLTGSEWAAAVALVEEPLAAVGYRVERDLAVRILSQANYYPSLIQLFCRELLRHLSEQAGGAKALRVGPPIRIVAEDVDDAFRNAGLRQRIRESFELTLNLDPRYRVIALVVAWQLAERRSVSEEVADLDVTTIRDATFNLWSGGFSADPSEDTFRALLDEMVGLGVLREHSGRYTLRGANVPLLLGDEDAVLNQLASLDDPETFDTFEPKTFRRPLVFAPQGASLKRTPPVADAADKRSPLTSSQEFELRAASNGVSLLCGVQASGLSDVVTCLETGDGNPPLFLPNGAGLKDLSDALTALVRRSPAGTSVIVVPLTVGWTEEWLHVANEALRRRNPRDRFIRVALLADSEHVWSLLREHGGGEVAIKAFRNLGIVVQSLRPWRDGAVRQWATDLQLNTTEGADFGLSAVRARTGMWPVLLNEYLRMARSARSARLANLGDDFFAKLIARDGVAAWERAFGLNASEPAAVLKQLLKVSEEFGEPITRETLVAFGEALTNDQVELAFEWAETLALVTAARDDDGEMRWQLDPLVEKLLKLTMLERHGQGSSSVDSLPAVPPDSTSVSELSDS